MQGVDDFIVMGIGGFFLITGIILVVLGKGKEKSYYDAPSVGSDAKKYVEPADTESDAMKDRRLSNEYTQFFLGR